MAFATLPVMAAAVRFAIPEPFVELRRPLTVRPVRGPRDVMLGWAGWDTTKATLAFATFPVMAAAVRFAIPEPFVELRRPLTVRPVSGPRDVMLGWAG